MDRFFELVSDVFGTFGAAFFVPVMIFIVAKFMGVSTRKSINSALLCAVGLTGFNLVIGSYMGVIAPVVTQMVENAGINLPVLDTGWQATAVIAYSTTIGIAFFGIAIAIQIILFFLKWTNVFMPSDLWNNYSFMVWGSMLFLLTGNLWLALLLMVIQNLFILLFSEAMANRWSTYYQYPNCCMTAPHHLEALPFAVIMNVVLNKLRLNRIKLDAQTLQKKFGVMGEPMFIGLFIGALIAIIGYYDSLNQLATWGIVTTAAISTAAVMAVFPKVAGIFASAFQPLPEAYKAKLANNSKQSEGRIWYLSINDAAAYGEPNTLITGILLIPIMLGLSFILPGNRTLPMADLVALPYMVSVFIAVSNGNIVKSLIKGAIWFSFGLIIASQLAPAFTQVALEAGFEIPVVGMYIISFGIMAHPFIAGVFYAFWLGGPVVIVAVIALYFVMHTLFRRNRETIVSFIEKNALT
ncbi:MAG: PTS galactitol transporter subunit IIC [Oscillospiraceae bacterium]|nr:PTS galactitol transporter subunit IIC [Oscillospiraceae bacterium]